MSSAAGSTRVLRHRSPVGEWELAVGRPSPEIEGAARAPAPGVAWTWQQLDWIETDETLRLLAQGCP